MNTNILIFPKQHIILKYFGDFFALSENLPVVWIVILRLNRGSYFIEFIETHWGKEIKMKFRTFNNTGA